MATATLTAGSRVRTVEPWMSAAADNAHDTWAHSQHSQRKLGTLKNKMSVCFAENFAISDEELVNS